MAEISNSDLQYLFSLQSTNLSLQLKNQELVQDNIALSNEIYRLRQLNQVYESMLLSYKRKQDMHQRGLQQIENSTKTILNRIEKSETQASTIIGEKFNSLKKQMVYKKMEALESKYEKRNQQYEELLGFKDKLERLKNSWEAKSKETTLESLFVWIYNQVVKSKSLNPRGKKHDKKIDSLHNSKIDSKKSLSRIDKGKQPESTMKQETGNPPYPPLQSTF